MYRFLIFLSGFLFPLSAACQGWADHLDKAHLHYSRGEHDAALTYFIKVKSHYPADSLQTASYIKLLNDIGKIYRDKSQYQQALPFYEEANQKMADIFGYYTNEQAMGFFTAGQLYYWLKEGEKADSNYNWAMRIWEKLHGRTGYVAGVHNALGVLHNDMANFEQAIAHHEEARAIREKLFGKKNGAYAQSCNNLAAIYWNLGQLDKAEPLALEAKELRATVPGIEKSYLAISCVNLANIYRDMGKLPEAEALYLEAKNIREAAFTRQHQLYTETCNILAGLYLYMNRLQEAEDLLNEARQLRSQMGLLGEYADAQISSNLAQVYHRQQKQDTAMMLALQALDIFEKSGEPALGEKAITAHLAGNISLHQKKFKEAGDFLSLSQQIWSKRLGEYHPDYISNLFSFARLYRLQGETNQAADYYQKAFRAQQKQMENFFSFTNEKEKNNFIQSVLLSKDEYLSFYDKDMPSGHKGLPLAVSLGSRNAILFSVQKLKNMVFNSRDTTLITQYEEWVQLKRQLLLLYQQGAGDKSTYSSGLQARADFLEKEIYRRLPAAVSTKDGDVVNNWPLIKSSLQKNEAMVEFVEFNYFDGLHYTDSFYYAALVLTPFMMEPQWVNLGSKAAVGMLLEPIAAPATAGKKENRGVIKLNSKAGSDKKLYDLLWTKLEPYLKHSTDIFYSPVGALNRVSFASLRKDAATLLSDDVKLQQLSAAQQLLNRHTSGLSKRGRAILYGGIEYGVDNTGSSTSFSYLPGTLKEVNAIAGILAKSNFDQQVISGKAATETSIKSFTGMKSPQVLHIATHGFYADSNMVSSISASLPAYVYNSPDPLLRSGLIMASAGAIKTEATGTDEDGILTAYEVANLQLQNTQLVILSACETALGDIQGTEGVYGLQRAFKMAGAQYIVMSLWPVPDDATAIFMQTFYSHLVTGKTIEEAFHLTQTSLKKQSRGNNSWAAWILYK